MKLATYGVIGMSMKQYFDFGRFLGSGGECAIGLALGAAFWSASCSSWGRAVPGIVDIIGDQKTFTE